jgi:hypothetical protein
MEIEAFLAQSPGIARLQHVRAELARLKVEFEGYHEERRLVRENTAARGDEQAVATAALTAERRRLYERQHILYVELRDALRALGGRV